MAPTAAAAAGASDGGGDPKKPIIVSPMVVRLEGPLWNPASARRFVALANVALKASVARIHAATVARTPVNTGALRASFGTLVTQEGALFEGVPDVPRYLIGAVGSPLTYAPHVEFGTRGAPRRWPPRAAIEAWVRRKRLAEKDLVQEVGRFGKARTTRLRSVEKATPEELAKLLAKRGVDRNAVERRIREIAFLIARKIAREGTPDRAMLHDAIEREAPWVRRAFQAAAKKWAQEMGRPG